MTILFQGNDLCLYYPLQRTSVNGFPLTQLSGWCRNLTEGNPSFAMSSYTLVRPRPSSSATCGMVSSIGRIVLVLVFLRLFIGFSFFFCLTQSFFQSGTCFRPVLARK